LGDHGWDCKCMDVKVDDVTGEEEEIFTPVDDSDYDFSEEFDLDESFLRSGDFDEDDVENFRS